MRYAQEYGGQKLHLVEEYIDNMTNQTLISRKALCGRKPDKRGQWRMTINMPLGHACKNCMRVYSAMVKQGGVK